MATTGEMCMDCGRYRLFPIPVAHEDEPDHECSACGARFHSDFMPSEP